MLIILITRLGIITYVMAVLAAAGPSSPRPVDVTVEPSSGGLIIADFGNAGSPCTKKTSQPKATTKNPRSCSETWRSRTPDTWSFVGFRFRPARIPHTGVSFLSLLGTLCGLFGTVVPAVMDRNQHKTFKDEVLSTHKSNPSLCRSGCSRFHRRHQRYRHTIRRRPRLRPSRPPPRFRYRHHPHRVRNSPCRHSLVLTIVTITIIIMSLIIIIIIIIIIVIIVVYTVCVGSVDPTSDRRVLRFKTRLSAAAVIRNCY